MYRTVYFNGTRWHVSANQPRTMILVMADQGTRTTLDSGQSVHIYGLGSDR